LGPIERFVTTLADGGIDLARAQVILNERVGDYPDEVVSRWLSGDVLPGLTIRGHLFEAATSDFDLIGWETRTFLGELPEALKPAVRALCVAARSGNADALSRALGGGVVIDGWDDGCDYALGYATERGHREIAATLLRLGAEPITFAKGKPNAFERILDRADAGMLQDFLTLAPRRSSGDAADLSALMRVAAAPADDPEMIRLLSEHGRFNASSFGMALMNALKNGRVRTAKALVDAGASPGALDESKRTPLMEASTRGLDALLEPLARAGSAIDARDAEGKTALALALDAGHTGVVETLLRLGADASGEALPPGVGDSRQGPSWLDREGVPVMFVFNRGFGLGFDPRSLDTPILYGGDYDGVRHLSAELMNTDFSRRELAEHGASWVLPFIEKLIRHEDFSLAELFEVARASGLEPQAKSDLPLP
jgi:ankyrin repeat protein